MNNPRMTVPFRWLIDWSILAVLAVLGVVELAIAITAERWREISVIFVVSGALSMFVSVVAVVSGPFGLGSTYSTRTAIPVGRGWWVRVIVLISVVFTVVIGLALFGFWFLLRYLWSLFRDGLDTWPLWPAPMVGAVSSLGLGWGLFMFRLRCRTVYGATEALAGAAIAWDRLSDFATMRELSEKVDKPILLGFLSAAVYLVVRGFDNIREGLQMEDRDGKPGETVVRDRLLRMIIDRFRSRESKAEPGRPAE